MTKKSAVRSRPPAWRARDASALYNGILGKAFGIELSYADSKSPSVSASGRHSPFVRPSSHHNGHAFTQAGSIPPHGENLANSNSSTFTRTDQFIVAQTPLRPRVI